MVYYAEMRPEYDQYSCATGEWMPGRDLLLVSEANPEWEREYAGLEVGKYRRIQAPPGAIDAAYIGANSLKEATRWAKAILR